MKFIKNLQLVNNLVWDLLEKKKRTLEEDDKMIHAAHSSRFHWGEIGTPVEFERGEWQISLVYSVLKKPESALYHGQRCLDICKIHNIEDFDLAFAYESLARAYEVAGDKENTKKFIQLAQKEGENIKKKEDKEYFLSELNTIPK